MSPRRRIGLALTLLLIAVLTYAAFLRHDAHIHAFLHAWRNRLATRAADPSGTLDSLPSFAQPFGDSIGGPVFTPLAAQPRLDPQSDAYLQPYVGDNPNFQAGWADAGPAQAHFDYNHPVYTASTSDIRVKLHCTANYNPYGCGAEGDVIFLPARAQRAGGADHHLGIIEPDGRTEYDLWSVDQDPPFSNGQTLTFAWGNKLRIDGRPLARTQPCQAQSLGSEDSCADVVPGIVGDAATAGGGALSLSQIYISELRRGNIAHALFIGVACFNTQAVYPALVPQGGRHICAGGIGLPIGSRIWYDLTPAQIAQLDLNDDQKTILRALHEYGAFVNDDGMNPMGAGAGFGAMLENQDVYWTQGTGDPVLAYAQSHQWQHIIDGDVDRYILEMDGATIDFAHHLHIVAPCVSQQHC